MNKKIKSKKKKINWILFDKFCWILFENKYLKINMRRKENWNGKRTIEWIFVYLILSIVIIQIQTKSLFPYWVYMNINSFLLDQFYLKRLEEERENIKSLLLMIVTMICSISNDYLHRYSFSKKIFFTF